jgi:putative copper export protein
VDVGWDLVLALHLLAMAFFVGAAVVPVERRVPDRERLRAIARRFGWGSLVAVAVLIATGAAMASHFGQWDNPKLQVKLGLVGLVGLLIAWHMLRPGWHLLEGAIFVCSLAIVWLGILIAE